MINNVRIAPKIAAMVLLPLLAAVVLGLMIWRGEAQDISAATEDKRIAESASAAGTLPRQLLAEILFQDLRSDNPTKVRVAGQVLVQRMNAFVDTSIERYEASPAADVLPPPLRRALDDEIATNIRIRAKAEAETLTLAEVETIVERRRRLQDDALEWMNRQAVDDPNGSWRALIVTTPSLQILIDGALVSFRAIAAGTMNAEDALFLRENLARIDNLAELEANLLPADVDLSRIDQDENTRNVDVIGRAALALEGLDPPQPAGLRELSGYYALALPVLSGWIERENALADDVIQRADDRISQARRRQLVTLAGVALTILLALAIAGLLARNIVGRLGAVSAQASRLNDGVILRERRAITGKDEIGVLAGAIDGVSDIFLRLIGQTEAIAAGRLDDQSLREPLPGALGSALQGGVDRVARSSAELVKLATHDDLTGLLDRAGLKRGTEALAASRGDGAAAVLFIDVDDFKDVNDARGHMAGDLVLIETAARLTEIARTDDLVARYGGDEFIIVAPYVSAPDAAARIADRIAKALAAPVDLAEGAISITASVGWAMAPPGMPLADAIRDADDAMYSAKHTEGTDVVGAADDGSAYSG